MTTHVLNEEQLQKMKAYPGFIAALDQSGGSTPHALALYGIKDHSWADDDEMFDLVHEMRTRIITSPGFSGERIIAAILFEDTMDREIEGRPTADYLGCEPGQHSGYRESAIRARRADRRRGPGADCRA
ncbi:MAG: hypothetical protein P8Y27_05685 [Chromatiaceae bacterium]